MVSPLCSSVYGSFTFFRCDSLSPTAQSSGRIHWREADSRILIHKYVSARLYLNWSDHISRVASLDLNAEEDIRWGELIDTDWNKWTAPLNLRRGGLPSNRRSAQAQRIVVSTGFISMIPYL